MANVFPSNAFASLEQPPPEEGGAPVGDTVRLLFKKMLDHQEAKGLEKYGTPLKTHNGRDPLIDALGELVDAFQYLVQGIMEKERSSCIREDRVLLDMCCHCSALKEGKCDGEKQ